MLLGLSEVTIGVQLVLMGHVSLSDLVPLVDGCEELVLGHAVLKSGLPLLFDKLLLLEEDHMELLL